MAIDRKRFIWITAVFAVLSLLHLTAGLQVKGLFGDIAKGLPIVFLFICACIYGRKHPLVIFALLFSFFGDYAAEIHFENRHLHFYLQILFFAIAQIFYIHEFLKHRPKRNRMPETLCSLTPIFCSGYACFLFGMLISCCLQRRERKKVFVTGAVLFVISDSLILVRMLLHGFPHAGLAIMTTYYLAQYLLNILVLAKDSCPETIS